MGSLPVIKRKVACWGSGRTCQMFLVAVNTHQCSRKGNGALILEEPEAGWKEGNATLIYWVSIRGNEALAVFFFSKIPVRRHEPCFLQGMNLSQNWCCMWDFFFLADNPGSMEGLMNGLSWNPSSCLVVWRHLYLGNWVLRLGVWDPSRIARKGCEYFFQPLENTPFLACRQHHSWPASLQGAFGDVCVQILSRICGCPLFSD